MKKNKYRFWSRTIGEYIAPIDIRQYIQNYGESTEFIDIIGNPSYGLVPEQFTTLKDSDGKEVYENDIIVGGSGENETPYLVIFKNGTFGVCRIKHEKTFVPFHQISFMFRGKIPFKVIGNIHTFKKKKS